MRDPEALAATVSYTPALPHLPVGARLRFFALAWLTLIGDPWCTSVVEHGYYPEMTGQQYRARRPRPREACALDAFRETARHVMVTEMIPEQVIEPAGAPLGLFSTIPTRARWPVLPEVWSTYFIIPKSDGGFRGCLDCRYYNLYVQSIYFKMDSLRTLRDLSLPGDWMVKLDLRHAYLVVGIHPNARPAFRFRTAHGDYQFRTICFGLRSAPRVFTRLLKPVFALLRKQGIRLVGFIDDVAILGRTPLEAVQNGMKVVALLTALGFIVHAIKSDLTPKQADGEFLGAVCDFRAEVMAFRMPGKKRRKLRASCRSLLKSSTPLSPRQLSRVLGTMVAARLMVDKAALNSRGLERDLKRALILTGEDWDVRLWTLSSEAVENLVWWIETLGQATECMMYLKVHELVIDCDASPWGFGGFLGSLATGGFWGLTERDMSQNAREMAAMDLSLRTFVKWLRGRSVLVLTDSATVCSYINRQGGRFPQLSRMSETILQWCSAERIALRCTHLPGKLNVRADVRSRWGETMAEWTLCPTVLTQALRQWSWPWPTLDLFASRHNRQCEKYYSLRMEPETAGINGLNREWPSQERLYAFPPVALLPTLVRRIRESGARMLLVTPAFGGSWYPLLLRMAVTAPLMLPAENLFLGLDRCYRQSPKFRTLIWLVRGHPEPNLPVTSLTPRELTPKASWPN